MNKEIRSLQILRGVAAVSVVFYHTHLILSEYGAGDILGWLALHGKVGVNIFFTLSGFIILKAHWEDISRPDRIGRYVYRRFSRVYPLYWILSLAFVAGAILGLGRPDFSWSPINLISSALLYSLTADVTPPLKVAWTLFYEVKFYIAFMILMVSRTVGTIAFAVWALVISIFTIEVGNVDAGWLSPWMLYFVAGMLVYLASSILSRKVGLIVLAVDVVFVAVYILTPKLHVTYSGGDILPSLLWLIPTCALGLLAVVLLENPRKSERRGFWELMGDASYSIYLVHSAAISVSVIIGKKLGLLSLGDGYPLFAAIFIGAIGAGLVVHVVLEKPLLKAMRRPFLRKDRQVVFEGGRGSSP